MMLENLSKNITKNCFGIFIFLYALANILVTVRQYNTGDNRANYYFGISPLHIIIVGILLLLIAFVLRQQKIKINNKYLLGIFIFACIITGLYWIFSNYPYLVEIDDAYNCYRAATLVGQGDYGPLGYKSYINTVFILSLWKSSSVILYSDI